MKYLSMSSTSFSSYGYRNKDHNRHVFGDSKDGIFDVFPTGQFYNTMAQPFVYYTEKTSKEKLMGRQKQRKINQNYFLKAFKWYSQERPQENKRIRSAEFPEFATWLDAKYNEYLREAEKPVHPLGSYQTSNVMETRCESCRIMEPRTAKRFGQIRSPWNRRRSQNKNATEDPSKTNTSCEFIMQPKELTAPASEFCNPSQNTSMNQFSVTGQRNVRITPAKARSVDHECQCYKEKPIHNKPVQYHSAKSCLCKCPMNDEMADFTQTSCAQKCRCMISPKLPKLFSKKNNVSCQCAEAIIKLDASTQYLDICTKAEKSKCEIPNFDKTCVTRDVLTVEKVTRGVSIFNNGYVQTSDHSINIEDGDCHECIYFMKIICPEKSN